jgi:paraquat-inducible protein A
VLVTRTVGRVDLPLALALTALLLMIPGALAPLLSVSTLGASRTNWLFSGVRIFTEQGFPELGTLVLVGAVVLPFAFLIALVVVLGSIHFGRTESRWLGPLYRWAGLIRPWMMLEVFLVGGFVAYTRIQTVATVEVDAGGWCLIVATFTTMLALTQLDDRTVWDALTLPGGSDANPIGPNSIEPGSMERGRRPAVACTVCDLIVPKGLAVQSCPRCNASLHMRKPASLPRTASLLIAGYLLYIPANLLPVMTLTSVGEEVEPSTIMSGVFELIHNNLWPLALIVFIASIVLPLIKLLGLTWMLIAIRVRSPHLLRARTRLFRGIEQIGRWSNIDVFMGSVLVALLSFGTLTTVRAEPGLVAFAAVVVLTMVATETFDARLMWDAAAERAE